MSLHRRAARRDTVEAEIVQALERVGVQVYRISGAGLPDLLCWYRGQWTPLEVKGPKGKLTEAQASAWLKSSTL
jgi:Holliday junction resolvase